MRFLLMRFEREPMHFAIISAGAAGNPTRMIHGYAQARKVVENGIDALWRSRIVRAYGYPGVA